MVPPSTHPTQPLQPLVRLGVVSLLVWAVACGPALAPEAVAPDSAAAASAAPATAAPASAAPASSSAAPSSADDAALGRADDAVAALAKTLSTRLLGAMKEGGAKAAVEVCAVEAQELTRRVAQDEGIRIGRASGHLRNTANTGPEWVQVWIASQGSGKGEGKGAVVSALRQVVDTEAGRVARVIKPITMGDKCLTCHGSQIAPEIASLIDERYPADDARGYFAGDLRGAFWAEVSVER